jgi:hypothetical protein
MNVLQTTWYPPTIYSTKHAASKWFGKTKEQNYHEHEL